MGVSIQSDGLSLGGHLARPAANEGAARRVLVLCHGLPAGRRGAATSGHTFPQLADRLSAEGDWTVLAFNFRGTGASEGDFSLGGWMHDLRAVVEYAEGLEDADGVWLAGFATGGSLALCVAGEDDRIRGVASFAAAADLGEWAQDPAAMLASIRELGLIKTPGFPEDAEAWASEVAQARPLDVVAKIPPRPLLIVHGSEDETVPAMDARALADAADGCADLRILTGAGHRLRHDPRAVAVLLGWMERQPL